MSSCLKLKAISACLGALTLSNAAASATLPRQTDGSPRVRSVVRADSRGRLVRTVVVSGRVLPKKIVDVASRAETRQDISDLPEIVESAAKKYEVDPLLVHAVIQAESAYDPHAVSPKGAQGLMQLMPDTARRFGVINSFDIRENIEGGVRYLKYLHSLFPQDLRLTLAAYNAGEGAVWKYNNQVPPYRETEDYVRRVSRKYDEAVRQAGKGQSAKSDEMQTASAPTVKPDMSLEPSYAPVLYHVDSQGRLHMQTPPGDSDIRTP